MEAERRQVTVLFTDMVGFTSFSERSGEEAAFTLMRSLSKLMDEAVREQGGFVRGFTGDGIMAVFGAPVAFEDAPLRACRAALSILQRLKAEWPALEAKHGVRPKLRIGLNTGAAVVGKVQERADVTVLGDTVNFASRLQALADADSVFMSESTHRLVQGLVEASFAGEHTIKGKAEPQKVFRLDALRVGATRFEAAVSRGLSTFVGREREMEVLERGLDKARSELRVIDIAAEPGMGKSRLLYEFRTRIGKERAFVLSGNCSPDGQQTPFLPFIEVVRGSFRVSAGEAERDIAQKLEMGLTALGLHTSRNRGLLIHLLGLKVPDDSLLGLDGVLIGLRTRELLQQLLEARCRLSPVVVVIEDLHWMDSVSEELLGKIIDSEVKLHLLVLHTRRPEYVPPWLDRSTATKLPLDPLPTGDIRHLVQARLGVEALPEALARQITDKAEGNPLFAEEIVSYLTERGILRAVAGKLEFDGSAVVAALPASVQGVLTARVDRLEPKDRSLLQAASVIGRQFDLLLLAAAVGESDIDDRLAAMQALDLVSRQSKSDDYVFKHALVRDSLYQSLLTERRSALHLKVAEEIERRSGNRLTEVAEVLAHHYSQTDHPDKAFVYVSMAGSKSLNVYSLDEATKHFAAALALLDKYPECASNDQVAEFLVPYTLLSNLNGQINFAISLAERYLARVNIIGDDPRAVLIRDQYAVVLALNRRFQKAAAVQIETSAMADRLGDSRSRAYALASEILVSSVIAPRSLDEFEMLKREALKAASDVPDAYIQHRTRNFIALDERSRGRITQARDMYRELIQVGQLWNDPRATGLGLTGLALIALTSESYAEALEYSEQALAAAITPVDRSNSVLVKACALVLLRRVEEGEKLLDEVLRRSSADGVLIRFFVGDPIIGVGKILHGNIADGVHQIEKAISRCQAEGTTDWADWARLILAEVYLQIIAGNERPPLSTLLKNLPILLQVIVTARWRVPAMVTKTLENPHLHPEGFHIGRAKMILGLLYKAKKKRALALQHLTEAKRIFSQFGQTPILARVETALAELGQ